MTRKITLLTILALLVASMVAPPAAVAGPSPMVFTQLNLVAMDWGDAMHGWAVGENGAALYTADGGISWHVQWLPTSADLTGVRFVGATRGWITTASGAVLRTGDGGLTWSVKQVTSKRLNAVDFYDSTHGWVVGEDLAAYRTTDGVNWTAMTLAAPSAAWSDNIKGVSFVSSTVGWVCGGDGVGDGFGDLYIARTTNGGDSWTKLSNGPDKPGGSDDMWSYDDIDFADASTGWVTGFLSEMHATTNGGASWVEQPAGGNSVDAYSTTRVAAADWIMGPGPTVGISVSTNGGASWIHTFQPVPEMYTYENYGPPDVAWQDGNNVWVVGPGFMVHHNVPDDSWISSQADDRWVSFVGGHDRYATSVELSKRGFPSASTVVLATGLAYPDGLSASGLCGSYDAPLLLTGSTLPAVVKAEITRLGATKVVIVGGTGAVPAAVATEVDAMPGVSVERIAGADRYETSRLVAERIHTVSGDRARAFIVRGDAFPDALAVGPVAYAQTYPILLVKPDAVPRATQIAIDGGGYGAFVVVGGTSAVNDSVMTTIESATGKSTIRVSGADRYATATAVAHYATADLMMTSPVIGLATGLNFPDALSAGPSLGSWNSVLLLTDPKTLSASAGTWTQSRTPVGGWIVGDRQGAVSDKAANEFSRLLP